MTDNIVKTTKRKLEIPHFVEITMPKRHFARYIRVSIFILWILLWILLDILLLLWYNFTDSGRQGGV